MRRPLLIEFFCGQGGAAMGYHRAGWDVIGIDAKPQPQFPFAFIQCRHDEVDPRLVALADALHGSPPCQFGTEQNNDKSRHPNLIPSTRAIFEASGKPWTIENVRAVARKGHLGFNPTSLFGTMFGNHVIDSQGRKFVLSRERAFQTNWGLKAPPDPGPGEHPVANVFGGHFRVRSGEFRTGKGTGRMVDLPGEDRRALAAELMGMPWATMNGMSEAVPPSYTEYIGTQLLKHFRQADGA